MGTVLLIEDSPTVRMVVSRFLRSAGYQLMETETAEKALELLKFGSFDLVIADINLPGMDGVDFLRELRSRPANAKVPVLVLTSDQTRDIRTRCSEAGATGFIAKPISQDDLLSVVSSLAQPSHKLIPGTFA